MEKKKYDLVQLQEMVDYLRRDSAIKNKKGIAFIGTSVLVWFGILMVHLTALPIQEKNLYTWFVVALLMPLAIMITRILKIKFQNKDNPLNQLGFLITMNEALYITIACWAYAEAPEKMLMILAMIFGAHLLLFGWLYQSRSYYISAGLVTIGALMIGSCYPTWVLAACMLVYEILLTMCLVMENRKG